MTEETKVCSKCGLEQPLSNFSMDRKHHRKWCKKCMAEKTREHYNKNIELMREKDRFRYYNDVKYRQGILDRNKEFRRNRTNEYILASARKRANKKGLDFDITLDDVVIPEVCPVLGIPIFVSEGYNRDNSPSLDRIDNTKGYVKGNVRVISWRANSLKRDASIEEMEKIIEYMKREVSHTLQE